MQPIFPRHRRGGTTCPDKPNERTFPPLGGRDIPPSAQENIDSAAHFIHGAIEVRPTDL